MLGAGDERVERIHRDGVVVDMVTNLPTEGVLRSIDDFRAGGVHLICQSADRADRADRERDPPVVVGEVGGAPE